ncbi:KTSC domain-containing protein [Methanoculleus sp. FWC-SCC1]|uniref:KTSC domain-containing protein n=1 Tax=Methanoculleus frigidifontis TaxID=2584085 RepID=A0ABT8MA95_9EURY|nr:KTSC domain-containing protein [Methanoculleus sp. FWC-SCC1]MDN7024859.1 KTSC domain-containing protein [Methanoculleus sp. FWC-SCC1]
MQRETIESAGFASVGYDRETEILRIEFAGGGVYEYVGVPPEVYEGLLSAESPGWFFREFIRERYPSEKIR